MRPGATTLLLTALVCMVLSEPRAAAAPALGDDEISCVDGSTLRGTILEVEPDEAVHIDVLGETRVVAWSEIAKIERDKFAEPSEPSPREPTATTPHVTLVAGRRRGSVHYRLYRRPELFRGEVEGGTKDEVCDMPCEIVVDNTADTDWVVGGTRFWGRQTTSKSFRLTPGATHVQLEARGGRTGVRILGWTMGVAGLLLMQPGMGLLIMGYVNETRPHRLAGTGLLATSGVLYIGGITSLLVGRLRVEVRGRR